ncbi:uncharacterized protein LOC110860881 isoform X2 [Folsomia candida]|uniref:uncharacterized protein LOC110860881 isoform X2 n=1 Tax=Folsomia candida TaxID=158441 RepID=UPI000B8F1500|nr:uncharacterized protein LOC110860881 isoform X2 [Folsomia candida]
MLYDNAPSRRKSSLAELHSSFNRMQTGSTTRSTSSNGPTSARRNKSRWDQPETSHSTGSLLSSMERFVQTVDDMNETILVPCRLMDMQFDESFVPPTPVPQLEKTSGMGLPNGGAFGPPSSGTSSTKLVDNHRIVSNLNGVDLYQFYSVLNNIKNDLMWGRKAGGVATTMPIMPPGTLSTSSSAASVISTLSSNTSSNASLSLVPNGMNGGGGDQNGHGQAGGGGSVKGHARRPSTVSTTSSTSASDTEFSELNEDSGVEAEHEDDMAQGVADAFHHHLSGLQQCLCDLTIAADYVTTRYSSALGGGL